MKRIAAVLLLSGIAIGGCSATQRVAEYDALAQHLRENTGAWIAARTRLRAMCQDGSTSCALRSIKMTNSARIDDWVVEPLPPYRIVVAIHDEEIRRRHVPRVYEEYMLGSAKYLAAQADDGAISVEQLERATNVTWSWMTDQVRAEAIVRLESVRAAQQADAQTWQTFNVIAGGLANVLTTAIIAAASAPRIYPAPAVSAVPSRTSCTAVPRRNTVTGKIMSVGVTCY